MQLNYAYSYLEAIGGVQPTSPFTPNQRLPDGTTIVTTVVPIGFQPTHMVIAQKLF